MSAPVKTPTAWRSARGTGFVVFIGSVPIVTNTAIKIVTNITKLPVLTNPTNTTPKSSTTWSQIG